MDDAVTTAAWTEEEADAFAIHPAKALALPAVPVAGKGYTQKLRMKHSVINIIKVRTLIYIRNFQI